MAKLGQLWAYTVGLGNKPTNSSVGFRLVGEATLIVFNE